MTFCSKAVSHGSHNHIKTFSTHRGNCASFSAWQGWALSQKEIAHLPTIPRYKLHNLLFIPSSLQAEIYFSNKTLMIKHPRLKTRSFLPLLAKSFLRAFRQRFWWVWWRFTHVLSNLYLLLNKPFSSDKRKL